MNTHHNALVRLLQNGRLQLSRISDDVLLLLSRLFPAVIFWQSGRTKMDGWQLSENAIYLFQEEYHLPLIDPVTAAYLASFAEHVFPLLLVLGLATRFAAMSLLGMIVVIQLLVYPDAWPTHGVWAIALIWVVAKGPGRWSMDTLWWRRASHAMT